MWLWVAYIVVFPTILTYLLNLWALKRVSSNLVAVLHLPSAALCRGGGPSGARGGATDARAAAAGLAIFSGLALVILAERRQHREIPLEAVGE